MGVEFYGKVCSEDCMLRHCLEGIDNPQAQANATVFVAKFFGRAMTYVLHFLCAQKPTSLGASDESNNWSSEASVVRKLASVPNCGHDRASDSTIEFQPPESDAKTLGPDLASFSQCTRFTPRGLNVGSSPSRSRLKSTLKRNRSDKDDIANCGLNGLDISLIIRQEKGRVQTPSEESETTTFANSSGLHGRISRNYYMELLDKIKGKLSSWKANILSFVGRITLAKSVLQALPSYLMQIVVLPASISKEIDSLNENVSEDSEVFYMLRSMHAPYKS